MGLESLKYRLNKMTTFAEGQEDIEKSCGHCLDSLKRNGGIADGFELKCLACPHGVHVDHIRIKRIFVDKGGA